MIDLLPSLLALAAVSFFIYRMRAFPVVQIFVSIIMAYVIVFPSLDYWLALDPPRSTFTYHQVLFILFFIIPILYFVRLLARRPPPQPVGVSVPVRLNGIIPVFLIGNLLSFVAIAYYYDLYLVRLSYGDVESDTSTAPTLLMFQYRMALETSFFLIIYLVFCLKAAGRDAPYRSIYKLVLTAYIATFGLFFLVNSRMQFLLLLLLVAVTTYRPGQYTFRRILAVAVSVLVLAVGLTLLREFVLENNNRVDASSTATLVRETALLIAGRLDSVIMLNRAGEYGLNPFSMNLSGLWYFLTFNVAFFTNPQLYQDIRAAELTSPSVYMINGIMSVREVDFPKSMIVDTFLIFGVYGLPFLSYLLSYAVTKIQFLMQSANISSRSLVIALYMLPLVCQFEKEFLGFLLLVLKWSPMLVFAIIARPRPAVTPLASSGPLAHG